MDTKSFGLKRYDVFLDIYMAYLYTLEIYAFCFPSGTGTKFGGYLNLSPTLNDNISLERLSNFALNANYIHYLSH